MCNKTKKNILITGANGQLGNCLRDRAATLSDSFTFFFTDIDTLDISDIESVKKIVHSNNIAVIINAAAYTAVDRAEDEVEKATSVNRDAVRNLAVVANERDALLIHISTDYVFDGRAAVPHREDDVKNPQSVYGRTKLAGEQTVEESGCKAVIIRTSWLYSEYGNNFVKTMLRLGGERKELGVVYDQIGAPTYAGDLADAILMMIGNDFRDKRTQYFHFANQGVCSWYDFAGAIMKIAGKKCKINPILTSEYPAKAPRPSYSVFNLSKIKSFLNFEIPYWYDSLTLIVNKLEDFEKK